MSNRIDKSELKKYFRSGSRPSQKQFEELIDNCYNGNLTSSVSGYSVLTDIEKGKTIASIKREAGKTHIIPFFERINVPHTRTFHYAIPVSGIADNIVLDKIVIDMAIPQNNKYKVRDKNKDVGIKQTINIEAITICNGSEEIYTSPSPFESTRSPIEIEIGKAVPQWSGIGIDIVISYDITSEIAVSDQLDIASESEDKLLHTFGNADCYFTNEEEK